MFDEVMTGTGRTGKMFAYEHFNVVPDILALGKGLSGGYFPIGATAVPQYIHEKIASESGVFGAGHSWGGNPLGCSVVSKTLDYIKEHNLVERSHTLGEYLNNKLDTLRSHPLVGDIRGKGLMRGIEFVRDRSTKNRLKRAWDSLPGYLLHALKKGCSLNIRAGVTGDRPVTQ